MSLVDRFRTLRSDKIGENLEKQYIGDLKGFNSTEMYEKGAKRIVADSNFIRSYSSIMEPHIEEGEYNAVSVDAAELNSLYRGEKNRQIEGHPGGFDVSSSVDYNFGIALGKAATEETPEIEDSELVRTVDGILRYRPAMYHATSAKVVKDGAVEWDSVIEDLEE